MYLTWAEKTISDFSDRNINSLYNEGFLFTREHLGSMYQTRSLRIDLSKFELSSENKRVLKKTEDVGFKTYEIPYENYDWKIGKLAKDFYETKFGPNIFSANKIKELLTTKHNFNKLFVFVSSSYQEGAGRVAEVDETPANSTGPASDHLLLERGGHVGYAICFESNELLHYSYPFYELRTQNFELNNIGMGMMLRAILYAKEQGKKYIYLGSAKDAKAKYKLQFAGLEWFDGEKWSNDLEELRNVLK